MKSVDAMRSGDDGVGGSVSETVQRLLESEPLHLGRDIPLKSNDFGLAILLREIDETVLPRILVFRCFPAGDLRLCVSNRRLFAVAEPGENVHLDSGQTSDPETAARTFVYKVRRVLGECESINAQPSIRLTQDFTLSVSCSAKLLAKVADDDDGFNDLACIDSALLSLLEKSKSACKSKVLDDGSVETSGAHEKYGPLATAHSEILRLWRTAGRVVEYPQMAFSVFPFGRGDFLVAIETSDTVLTALVSDDLMDDLISAWRETAKSQSAATTVAR
ncbi:MAG: hypothetical protein AAF484_12025 [Pseudomonadota bacterium]